MNENNKIFLFILIIAVFIIGAIIPISWIDIVDKPNSFPSIEIWYSYQYPQAVLLNGTRTMTGQLRLGTHSLTTSNITQVNNFNAEYWQGYHFSDYLDQAVKTTSNVQFNGLTIVSSSITIGSTHNLKIINQGSDWWIYPNEAYSIKFINFGMTRANLEITDSGNTTIHGTSLIEQGIITRYINGDYGASWENITLPNGTNGMVIIAYNSNSGVLSSRVYFYSGSAWHYINQIG